MEIERDMIQEDADSALKQEEMAEAQHTYEAEMELWKGDEFSKPTFQEWITEVSSRLNDN